MKSNNPSAGVRAFIRRTKRHHVCESCQVTVLPPSSLRFCDACRSRLASSS